MKKIWKFPLELADEQVIQVPAGADILCVQVQLDVLCMWALVDPSAKLVTERFYVFGTGWEVPEEITGLNYVGTVQINEGHEIYHIFRE